MINTSTAYKKTLAEDKRVFYRRAVIVLRDGTLLEVDDSVIMQDGMKFEDACSGTSSFDIGSVIINKCTLNINNMYDEYSVYDFTDAVITPYVGLGLEDGTIEWLRKGKFTVDSPSYNGAYISLEALDNMYKLDVDYAGVTTGYPASLKVIIRDICLYCGISLDSQTFDFEDYIVSTRPVDEALTCRAVLSYVCQIAGAFARFNNNGLLEIKWYDTVAFALNASLDGGIFDSADPYQTGDEADGGNFIVYDQATDFDGGSFEDMQWYHHVYAYSSQDVITDDVVITGVQVSENTEDSIIYTSGEEGYMLSVSANKMIEAGRGQIVANHLAEKIVGMKFRPISVSALGDPAMEAGDMMYVSDRKGNTYQSYVTNISYAIGNYATISCGAETPSKNTSSQYSVETQTIVRAKESAKVIAGIFTGAALNAMGYFETRKTQSDGSLIVYMHDKPNLEESMIIYMKTIDGFFLSRDGGKTYESGFDSEGNAALNILDAIGIRFDWARGGVLTLGGLENGDGSLTVKNSQGNEIIKIGMSGIELADGASLISESGVCGNLQFFSGQGAQTLGPDADDEEVGSNLYINAYIPENYVIKEAILVLTVAKATWADGVTGETRVGYPRSITLQYGSDLGLEIAGYTWGEYYLTTENFSEVPTEAAGDFASKPNGVTSGTKTIKSGDLKEFLSPGTMNMFMISSAHPPSGTYGLDALAYTGSAFATLNVIGYTKNG